MGHTSCSFQKSHELFLCAVVSAYQPRPPYSYSIIDKIAPWHRRSQIRVHQFMRVRVSSLKHTHDTNPHLVVYFPKMTSKLPASSGEFRKVLFTGLYSQVVLMTIPVGGDIGDEVHTVDQALTFTSGKGKATINGKDQDVEAGDLMVVPAGTQHQFINTGDSPLYITRRSKVIRKRTMELTRRQSGVRRARRRTRMLVWLSSVESTECISCSRFDPSVAFHRSYGTYGEEAESR